MGDVLALVVRDGDNLTESAITWRSADELKRKKDDAVGAVVKGTEVMIQKDSALLDVHDLQRCDLTYPASHSLFIGDHDPVRPRFCV